MTPNESAPKDPNVSAEPSSGPEKREKEEVKKTRSESHTSIQEKITPSLP